MLVLKYLYASETAFKSCGQGNRILAAFNLNLISIHHLCRRILHTQPKLGPSPKERRCSSMHLMRTLHRRWAVSTGQSQSTKSLTYSHT